MARIAQRGRGDVYERGAGDHPRVTALDAVVGFASREFRGAARLRLVAVIFEGTPAPDATENPESVFGVIRGAGFRIEALPRTDPTEASSASNYLATRG